MKARGFPRASIPREIYLARNVGWREFEETESFEPIVAPFQNPAHRPVSGKTPRNAIRSLGVNNRAVNSSVAFSAHGLLSKQGWITRGNIVVPSRENRETLTRLIQTTGKRYGKTRANLLANIMARYVAASEPLRGLTRKETRKSVSPKQSSALPCEGCRLCGKTH